MRSFASRYLGISPSSTNLKVGGTWGSHASGLHQRVILGQKNYFPETTARPKMGPTNLDEEFARSHDKTSVSVADSCSKLTKCSSIAGVRVCAKEHLWQHVVHVLVTTTTVLEMVEAPEWCQLPQMQKRQTHLTRTAVTLLGKRHMTYTLVVGVYLTNQRVRHC